jgi:manganese transport protein
MLVNAAILVMAAAIFFERRIVVTEIQQAHQLLEPLLGSALAPVLFGLALLCSGQSSTITGTMAGQIVMEGFLNFRMRPWLRRLTTRSLAILPAALTIWIAGEQGTFQLLILSQVILSMQLPFAIVPLIRFTGQRRRMGSFVNAPWIRVASWAVAAVIIALNVRLVWLTLGEWLEAAAARRGLILLVSLPVLCGIALLLLWIVLEPWLPRWFRRRAAAPAALPAGAAADLAVPLYRTVLVPLDHTARDRGAIAHAATIARLHRARLVLLHVEEDVTSQVYGDLASTAEVQAGEKYLDDIVAALKAQGLDVAVTVRHSRDPKSEIVAVARELKPDLVIMGAHGHKGIQDLIFGQTINAVRHDLDVPLLIVRGEPPHTPGE